MRSRRSVSSTGATANGAAARAAAPALVARRSARSARVRVVAAAAHAGTPAMRYGARLLAGRTPERVADRVSQLGAIQGVEVKLAHAVALQLLHLLDRDAGGDHAPGLGDRPRGRAKRSCSQSGMLAPQRAAKRSTCGKRVIGRMPGTIGARMPAAAQRSRKRRNASVS